MTDTIEPGDLIRLRDGTVSVCQAACVCCEVIAKGPGWTRHDGSSVNPVPGAECEIFGSAEAVVSPEQSEVWVWPKIKFYRVTRPAAPSHPPAPQPGWVATVTLTLVETGQDNWKAKLFDGLPGVISAKEAASLDWSPPPPPPWEPEIGGRAYCDRSDYTVLAIDGDEAWLKLDNGGRFTAALSDLSPPKGGA